MSRSVQRAASSLGDGGASIASTPELDYFSSTFTGFTAQRLIQARDTVFFTTHDSLESSSRLAALVESLNHVQGKVSEPTNGRHCVPEERAQQVGRAVMEWCATARVRQTWRQET